MDRRKVLFSHLIINTPESRRVYDSHSLTIAAAFIKTLELRFAGNQFRFECTSVLISEWIFQVEKMANAKQEVKYTKVSDFDSLIRKIYSRAPAKLFN